jgi:hypothetical protein
MFCQLVILEGISLALGHYIYFSFVKKIIKPFCSFVNKTPNFTLGIIEKKSFLISGRGDIFLTKCYLTECRVDEMTKRHFK